jgi:hypothetical protein
MERAMPTQIETVDQSAEVAAAKMCFVISPYNSYADEVRKLLIHPVCEALEYRVELADDQLSDCIRDGIVTSLAVAPMVVAYLGRRDPEWNSNVVLELGYRLATRLPIVILCDSVPDLKLPFNIQDDRVVLIPECKDLTPELIATTKSKIEGKIRKAEKNRKDLLSNQAVAVIHAPKDEIVPEKTFYVAASRRATDLFGVKGQLVGRTLAQFVVDRKRDMPAYQFEAFVQEQGAIANNAAPNGAIVIARVPIVFRSGPQAGRAYLPVIVDYQQVGEIQEYTVLYLDVTSNTKYIHDTVNDRWCFVSSLNPNVRRLDVPPDVNERDRSDRVFLAYNSKDQERVQALYDLLVEQGCDPWFDVKCLTPGKLINSSIEEALANCRAAFIFIGPNGFGKYQNTLELPMLLDLMMNKGLTVVPVLMDGLAKPPGLLVTFRGITYEQAYSADWIRGFLRDIMIK